MVATTERRKGVGGNTKLDGMADHIVIGASHPWLPRNTLAIEQTIAFLRDGQFSTLLPQPPPSS
jgi:hypothetical protein